MINSPFKQDILKGKLAVITGGGSGICFGIAEVFGKHGGKVVILGRRKNVLEEAVSKLQKQGIESDYFQCDVRDFKLCNEVAQKIFDKHGQIDILVNGAAGNFLCSAEDLSPNAFATVIQIDLIGTFNMTKACLNFLKKSKSPLVINISARLDGTPWQSHAASAKAGIDSLTKNWCTEWIQFDTPVRVNGIAPGPIEKTVGMSKLAPPGNEMKGQGLPRWGKIEEIAYTALFLTTEVADYINGETIVVDGGSSLLNRLFVPKSIYEQIKKKSKL